MYGCEGALAVCGEEDGETCMHTRAREQVGSQDPRVHFKVHDSLL